MRDQRGLHEFRSTQDMVWFRNGDKNRLYHIKGFEMGHHGESVGGARLYRTKKHCLKFSGSV